MVSLLHFLAGLASLSCLLPLQSVEGLTVPFHRTFASSSSTTTRLWASGASIEHIKQSGAGVAVIPPGDRRLFDPELEGKIGGTVLTERLAQGANYMPPPTTTATATFTAFTAATTTAPANVHVIEAQDWLEDIGIPVNFAKNTAPVTAKVLGRTRLITPDAPGDIEHIVLKLPEGFHYVEGQSISIIPPGFDATGKPHKPRLYSIASTRYGDLLDGSTVSLCVRRAEYVDPSTGVIDPSKKGVCSNFLCDANPGTLVQVAGPVGKTMLLPESNDVDMILVATGTGIAPFRAFLHRLFMEETVARHLYTGHVWLILGVPVTGGLLYPDELAAMQQNAQQPTSGASLEVTYAISREMQNKQGGKLYVQDVLAERADELFERLEKGAYIYFCGLKGMMPGILTALEQVAASRGLEWATTLKKLQANNQWHVEVY